MRRLRGFSSLLLAFSFLGVATTGLMMWIPPLMPDVGKHAVETIHLGLSILLIIAAVAHIAFNWNTLLGYFWSKSRGPNLVGETIVAAVLTVGVVAGVLLMPEPPEMKFLRMSPRQIAEQSGMTKAEVVALLMEDGLKVGDGERPLMIVCRECEVNPRQIIEHVRQSHPRLLSE